MSNVRVLGKPAARATASLTSASAISASRQRTTQLEEVIRLEHERVLLALAQGNDTVTSQLKSMAGKIVKASFPVGSPRVIPQMSSTHTDSLEQARYCCRA